MTKYKCPRCAGTNLGVVITAPAKLIQTDDNFETVLCDGDCHEWDFSSRMWCEDCETWASSSFFEVLPGDQPKHVTREQIAQAVAAARRNP
jgi:hypothetical protein